MKYLLKIYLLTLLVVININAFDYSRSYYPDVTVDTGDSIRISVSLSNDSPDSLKGIVYSEQIPAGVNVFSEKVQINGVDFLNYTLETGDIGEVEVNRIPYRWIIQLPEDLSSTGYLLNDDILTIQYGITTSSPTSFSFNDDAWFGGLYGSASYRAVFGYDSLNSVTLSFTTPVNSPPAATDDDASTNEDIPVVINVLSNDSDIDGSLNPATVNVISNPAHGSTGNINPTTGEITYIPSPDYNGNDEFTYNVRDNQNAVSNTAAVNVSINPVNDPPVAVGDNAATVQDSLIIINVLANDHDIDGNIVPASLTVQSNPAHGTIANINTTNGTISYRPDTGYFGNDEFSYTVRDNSNSLSNAATVYISIAEKNYTGPAIPTNVQIRK